MCGRYLYNPTAEDLREVFAIEGSIESIANYNVAPTQQMPVIREDEKGHRKLAPLRWGFVPGWKDHPKKGPTPINAKAETIAESRMFRNAFKRRRCIVPATGFYEWLIQDKKKHPVLLRMRSGKPFGFAGLWEHWERPDHPALETFTIVTTEPNEVVAKVHNRMPAILTAECYGLWLDPKIQDPPTLLKCLAPYPGAEMEAVRVSDRVGNVANDDPSLLEAIGI